MRRANAAVRHGNHKIGLHRVFARELAAHFLAHVIDAAPGNGAVRPREIDVFKNAEGAALVCGKRLQAGQPFFVDDDDFARLHVADELGLNLVEGHRFAGQHPRVVHAADAQRAEPERVARADQFLLRHDDQRIRAFDAAHRLHERVFHAADRRLREHHDDDFAVHGRLEDESAAFEFVAEHGGVGQVAVVGDGDLAAHAIHRERLGVAEVRRAGGGIARVGDGHVADEVVQDFGVVENLRHEAHAMMLVKLAVVTGDDAGAFLSAMLERVKAVVGKFGGIRMAENAEHAAIMFGIILLLHRPRR